MWDCPDPFEFYQLIGWAAAILSIASYQLLNPRHTLSCKVFSASLFALHYFGLGAEIAVIVCLASVCRDFLTIFINKKALNYVLAIYMTAFWAVVLIWGNSVDDYLLACATSLAAVSNYYRDYFWRFRIYIFIHHILWCIASVLMTSYPGLIVTVLNMISNVVGMMRYKFKGEKI